MAKTKSKRVTKIEKERRILTIQGWIIDGVQDDFIFRQIRKSWKLSPRQTRRYIKQAYESWRKDEEIDVESQRSAAIARLQKISGDMEAKYRSTPRGASVLLSIEKEIHRLRNIKPPKEIKHTVKEVSEMTPEERAERLKELKKMILSNEQNKR